MRTGVGLSAGEKSASLVGVVGGGGTNWGDGDRTMYGGLCGTGATGGATGKEGGKSGKAKSGARGRC